MWNYEPPRVAFDILQREKQGGGLALPDTRLYYPAWHLARTIDWCRHAKIKQWVDVEHALSPYVYRGYHGVNHMYHPR